jgi:tetratricopeptide (TPR) repeat protein
MSHLNNLANRYADFGENQEALKLFEEAMLFARQSRDTYAEAVIRESSGHVHAAMGHYGHAKSSYGAALKIADEIASIQVQNYSHWGLATVALFEDDMPTARREVELAVR